MRGRRRRGGGGRGGVRRRRRRRRPRRRRRRVEAGVHLHRAALHAHPHHAVPPHAGELLSTATVVAMIGGEDELLTISHALRVPLLQHCLGPEDQYLSMEHGMVAAAQEPVEASTASCSYVPSDENSGTPVMAYDSNPPPANIA